MAHNNLMAKISNLKSMKKDFEDMVVILAEEIKVRKNMEERSVYTLEKKKVEGIIQQITNQIQSMEAIFFQTIYCGEK